MKSVILFFSEKTKALILTVCLLFSVFSGNAYALRVVPEKSLAQSNSTAQFLIIADDDENIKNSDIKVEGLPATLAYTINCTGKRKNDCSGPEDPNNLPIFILTIKIPDSESDSNNNFKVIIDNKNKSESTTLNLDIQNDIQFFHPGIMLSSNMMIQMKAHLQSNDPVWNKAYQQVLKSRFAALDYKPAAHSAVNADEQAADDLRNDAIAAYTQALLWVITGNSRYADNSINIMNAWSEAQTNDFTGSNRFNLAAWMGDVWPRAAEIIRYTYQDSAGKPIWQEQDIRRFSQMLQQRYADFISAGFFTSGQYGGNLIASQAAAFIHIGVFTENKKIYMSGIDKWRRMLPAYIYLKSDGNLPVPPDFWRNSYIDRNNLLTSYWRNQNLSDEALQDGGFTQETCRDLGHVLWGISALANGAQTARIQGLDLNNETTLNTSNIQRLSKGLEFNVAFLNSAAPGSNKITVPEGLCNGVINAGSTTGKGEVLFNDIVNRKGRSLPETAKYLNAQRPTGASYFMIWETLTHYLNP